jgi:nitrogen regulatory protein PII
MKTIGIVTDNYKLERFKKELTAKGFTEFEVTPLTGETSTIKLTIKPSQLHDVAKVCKLVELRYNHSN